MQEEVTDDKSAFSALPVETILHLFTFLDPKTLTIIMFVSKFFMDIVKSNDVLLWKKFIRDSINLPETMTYKSAFFYTPCYRKHEFFSGHMEELIAEVNTLSITLKNENVFERKIKLFTLIENDKKYASAILHAAEANAFIDKHFLKDIITLEQTCIDIILNHADMLHQHINVFVLKLMVEKNTASVKKILNSKCDELLNVIDDILLKQMLEVDPESIALIKNHQSPHIKNAFAAYKKIEAYVDKKVRQKEEEQRQIKKPESPSKCLMM